MTPPTQTFSISRANKLSPNEYHVCPTFTREWYSDHSRNIAGRLAAPLATTKHDTPAPTAAVHHRLDAVGDTNQKTVGIYIISFGHRMSAGTVGGERADNIKTGEMSAL